MLKSKLNHIKLLIRNNCFISKKVKSGYSLLFQSKNKRLFLLLEEVGFFKFHISNNKYIVSLHQIVAFIYKGYKAFLNGFTAHKNDVEIHHIDSNPSNNSPGNLIYVSPQEHLLITQATTINSISMVKHSLPCPFNNQGVSISCPIKRLAYLVFITIKRTFNSLGVSTNIPKFEILCSIPSNYTIRRINWCPKFIKKLLKEISCYSY